MMHLFYIVIMVIITSFYFFPFEFTFLPGVNTKMAMAGIGLVLLSVDLAKSHKSVIGKDFFKLSLWALGVSLVCFLSVVYNETYDYTYASYIISMWVWASGAYVVVTLIRWIHKRASVVLVCNYLIAVCVMQCILAMMIDKIPAFENAVNSVVSGLGFVELDTLEEAKRLYGIGASLDVAGTRFASVLVMIAFLVVYLDNTRLRKYLWLYVLSVLIIGIIGNMMSRTTTVGLILFIAYLIYASKIYMLKVHYSTRHLFLWLGVGLLVLIPLVTFLYNTDMDIRSNIRFAFEGFFSLVEKGKWDVHSNEILKNMYVFPDNIKTWIIGDGYMENPYVSDPYYVGPRWHGYYMATDVGYLRFIFYFGLIGLSIFSYFMFLAGKINVNRFKEQKLLFWMLIAVHFIVWFKVATDIFLVFALFLMIDEGENEEYNNSILLNEINHIE